LTNRYLLEEIAQPVMQVGAALLLSINEIITQNLHKLSATKRRISSVKYFNLKCFNLKNDNGNPGLRFSREIQILSAKFSTQNWIK